MADTELNAKTIALIDSLKSTTGEYGLANGGSEYRIITEIFLYKFFNSHKNPPIINGAGDGSRTHTTSLEGWNSTAKLHPQIY